MKLMFKDNMALKYFISLIVIAINLYLLFLVSLVTYYNFKRSDKK